MNPTSSILKKNRGWNDGMKSRSRTHDYGVANSRHVYYLQVILSANEIDEGTQDWGKHFQGTCIYRW